jgi:hypothetical protein
MHYGKGQEFVATNDLEFNPTLQQSGHQAGLIMRRTACD